ncbi:hypothetical protein O0L34_g13103 [Tuta absoluta]|nr:hypothetical protein O0L34_g13103 [Tuta absoluta]
MKSLVLTALLATVAYASLSENLENQTQWPWRVGSLYRYDVEMNNLVRLPEGATTGNAFRANLLVRVKTPGVLLARLQNPRNAHLHHEISDWHMLPEDLKYENVKALEMPFEIRVSGGRVLSINLPKTMSIQHENVIKGLLSTLQVDLSTHRVERNPKNFYDQEAYQGQFVKMETDVTGDCDTLYTVAPGSSPFYRLLIDRLVESKLTNFAKESDFVTISKSRDYGHCHHRIGYHFGVPEFAEWTGVADRVHKEQFINRAANTKILTGKQGTIYGAETHNAIYVHPYVSGEQKAEVLSTVKMSLVEFAEQDTETWQVSETRTVQSLLYSMTKKLTAYHDRSEETYVPEEVDVADKENRVRRSARMPAKFTSTSRLMNLEHSHESNDEDSSHSTSAYVNEEFLDSNEPAYAALYMNPQAHKPAKQNPKNVHKLIQELAQLLQNPNNMPKADFLTKFNILVRLVASMDTEQFKEMNQILKIDNLPKDNVSRDLLTIYRDAVAQAGTLPAFKQIVSWIQNEKITGEDAAELVSTLAYTLRYPTKATMVQFFDLAMSPVVMKQRFLNNTALMAATKFINMGHVNNQTAHHFYPTHMYGRLARQHDNFVHEEVLPRLRLALEQAVQQQDNNKAQVYIRVIGNIAHRSIIQVFGPYLEGKIPMSKFLRVQMVDSLVILARERDSYVRTVLFSILRNTAEPYEVRVAAINNLFIAHPTPVMMQAMAHMTYDDISIYVRAAIKSAIENAAQQRKDLDLAATAEAARPMLTKEKFGWQFAYNRFNEKYDNMFDLGLKGDLAMIGSKDSILPKYLRYSWKNHANRRDSISASVSSVQKLVEMLKQIVNDMQDGTVNPVNHKFSASKISEMLNIKREPQNPLEAAFYIGLWNQQRYFTIQDLEAIIMELRQMKSMHYTKLFNQAQISVMFPLASGMPFIYRYKEPTVVHLRGKFDNNNEKKTYVSEIEFTFARNIDGNVGFLDTLSNHIASVGFVNKVQLSVPLQLSLEKDKMEQKIHFNLLPRTIAHYSVWPYSTIQKKDTLVPISLDPATKLITRTKMYFDADRHPLSLLKGYSFSTDYRSPSVMLTNIMKAIRQKDVALTHINLITTKPYEITLNVAYDTFYNLNEVAQEKLIASMEPVKMVMDGSIRRPLWAKRVASGISNARAQVIEMYFKRPTGSLIRLAAALAESPIDKKIQYVFSVRTGQENQEMLQTLADGVGMVTRPDVTALNAQVALQKEQVANFEFDLKNIYGNVNLKGKAIRTKEYRDALLKRSWAKACIEQIKQQNFYQDVCHKLIVMAQTPNSINIDVTYEFMWDIMKDVMRVSQKETWQRWEQVPGKDHNKTMKKMINIIINNDYLENNMNVKTNLDGFLWNGERDIQIPRSVAVALSSYQPIKPHERVANYYTGHLYQPYCSVDGSRIRTFSGRSYTYTLTPSWYVVMQDAPRKRSSQDELVVVARRPVEEQMEVYISYQSETGKDVEIEIKPATGTPSVEVKTNSKKISEGRVTIYKDETEQVPLLEYYVLPDGILMLNIRENRLRAMYDGRRLVILTREGRNEVRGICGLMNGEKNDDFWAPQSLVVSDKHFAASYALKDGIDDATRQLQDEAKNWAYLRTQTYTTDLKSDSEWQKWLAGSTEKSMDSPAVYRARLHLKQPRGTCVSAKQVQYYETSSKICVTTMPLEACPSHCRGEGYKVSPASVVCGSKSDVTFQEYVKQINMGQNPKVTGVTRPIQYRIPTSCVA